MQVMTLTNEAMTEEMNKCKAILAHQLYEAGVINEEQVQQIQEDFALIIAPSSMFGTKVKEALGWKDKSTYYKVVQLNNFNKNNKENEDVHQSEDSDSEGVDSGD
jgi:hypothetical protein